MLLGSCEVANLPPIQLNSNSNCGCKILNNEKENPSGDSLSVCYFPRSICQLIFGCLLEVTLIWCGQFVNWNRKISVSRFLRLCLCLCEFVFEWVCKLALWYTLSVLSHTRIQINKHAFRHIQYFISRHCMHACMHMLASISLCEIVAREPPHPNCLWIRIELITRKWTRAYWEAMPRVFSIIVKNYMDNEDGDLIQALTTNFNYRSSPHTTQQNSYSSLVYAPIVIVCVPDRKSTWEWYSRRRLRCSTTSMTQFFSFVALHYCCCCCYY